MGVGLKRWLQYPPHFAMMAVLFIFGKYMDDSEIRRMSDFRNKSKLFGRERKEGDYDPWDYYFK